MKNLYYDNFTFEPESFKGLTYNIESIKLDLAHKKIYLKIRETEDFAVYQWISNLNKESSKTVFCDEKYNTGVLTINKKDGTEVIKHAQFLFEELSLFKHKSNYNIKVFVNNEETNLIEHHIVLKYKKEKYLTK